MTSGTTLNITSLSPTLSTPFLPTHLHNGQVDAGLGAEEPVENLIDGNLELGKKFGQSQSGEVLYTHSPQFRYQPREIIFGDYINYTAAREQQFTSYLRHRQRSR